MHCNVMYAWLYFVASIFYCVQCQPGKWDATRPRRLQSWSGRPAHLTQARSYRTQFCTVTVTKIWTLYSQTKKLDHKTKKKILTS